MSIVAAFHVKCAEDMKGRRVTVLQHWMIEAGWTDIALAAELNKLLPGENIHPRTVGRWRKGISMPRLTALRGLFQISGGKITPNTFVEDPKISTE
jgi:hypothetical protein